MKVLALDIATVTGCAVGVAGDKPVAWSVDLGKAPDERRFSNVLRLTSDLLAEHAPDLLAVEAPVGGPKTSHYLVGLLACVRGCAWNRSVPVEMCAIASVRKHFLGKALSTKDFPGLKPAAAKRAIKEQVMNRCALLGWNVPDADAADAAAVWDFTCSRHSKAHQTVGGLFA